MVPSRCNTLKFVTETPDFFLVIPAYCEQHRLPAFLRELVEVLAGAPFTTSIQIVDDGSPVADREELLGAIESIPTYPPVGIAPMLGLDRHAGKGQAIRSGWASCVACRWLAFVDADGAIPAREVKRVLTDIWETSEQSDAGAFIAVRKAEGARRIQRHWLRGLGSRLFTVLINSLFRTRFRDTQCGFKVVQHSAWKLIQPQCIEKGFCFDIELLALLGKVPAAVREIPIDWQERAGGHVHVVRDGTAALIQALRLRRRLSRL